MVICYSWMVICYLLIREALAWAVLIDAPRMQASSRFSLIRFSTKTVGTIRASRMMSSQMPVSLSSLKAIRSLCTKSARLSAPPRFSVVWGWRSARTQDLAGNMTSGRCFRKMSDQFNNFYRKRHQSALKLIGSSLRHSILLTYFAFPLFWSKKNHK